MRHKDIQKQGTEKTTSRLETAIEYNGTVTEP